MSDVVVIGGGAAGLMCAATAGHRGRSVTVLEHGDRIGRKILISGGGRCNFTNIHTSPQNYLSSNPNFCKSALARYQPADFISLVERHGIKYHEKTLGQLFCDHSSRDIVDMLHQECLDNEVKIQTGVKIKSLKQRSGHKDFEIESSQGMMTTPRVVIATGGLSLPKLGATDFAYQAAQHFGLKVLPLRAGLVPLTFAGPFLDFCRELSGISLPCSAQIIGEKKLHHSTSFTAPILFTHRGLSGPGILQISSYWQSPATIRLNLFPENNAREWLEENRSAGIRLNTLLSRKFPERFADRWSTSLAPLRAVKEYSTSELDDLAKKLEHWILEPAGTEGYATAEVTVGGVDTRELSSKTMESFKVPGLYFIGEAVDVTGWLGGYNFQWAWASGHACGEAV